MPSVAPSQPERDLQPDASWSVALRPEVANLHVAGASSRPSVGLSLADTSEVIITGTSRGGRRAVDYATGGALSQSVSVVGAARSDDQLVGHKVPNFRHVAGDDALGGVSAGLFRATVSQDSTPYFARVATDERHHHVQEAYIC